MSGFERIKEEKKARIREAAFQLFTEKGYKNVKISEIAKLADVSQVTIYNHFESKEALFRDLIIRYMEDIYEDYSQMVESEKTFAEKLEYMYTGKMKAAQLFNPELMERMLEDPVLMDYIQQYSEEKGYPLIFKLIEDGKKEGSVSHDFSMESIIFFLNMFEDATRKNSHLFIGNDRLPFMEDVYNLIFYGLLGKPKE